MLVIEYTNIRYHYNSQHSNGQSIMLSKTENDDKNLYFDLERHFRLQYDRLLKRRLFSETLLKTPTKEWHCVFLELRLRQHIGMTLIKGWSFSATSCLLCPDACLVPFVVFIEIPAFITHCPVVLLIEGGRVCQNYMCSPKMKVDSVQ